MKLSVRSVIFLGLSASVINGAAGLAVAALGLAVVYQWLIFGLQVGTNITILVVRLRVQQGDEESDSGPAVDYKTLKWLLGGKGVAVWISWLILLLVFEQPPLPLILTLALGFLVLYQIFDLGLKSDREFQ